MTDSPEVGKLRKEAEQAKISEVPAQEIMDTQVISIDHESMIYTAVQTLASKEVLGAPVVNQSQKLVGVVTEYDLLLQTATRDVRDKISFTKDVVSISPHTPIRDIIVIFYKQGFRWLPVVESDQKVVGIVRRIDVLNRLLKQPKRQGS